MKLKFCNCGMCRYGRKKWGNPVMIKQYKRKYRHLTKQKIKNMKNFNDLEDLDLNLPIYISIPYTD